MSWMVEFRPEVRRDVTQAAHWYESREPGLGNDFIEEIFKVWDDICEFPLIGGKRHSTLDLRWRYPARFPYRVIYTVDEAARAILVIAVLHAARHDDGWRKRIR
ncbi:type II toxin-antitoxin system RelE/ParE family toxin [Luteolibacter sp. SL250]|uniref:type II toxin-antitoxin system RelE/ParE family toxin n=1 Tax=Luteolibacter sp. SL250 TaxID=2995170 RepID=UPI0022718B63|nr:type II toxin-antitoxin system RelE/ParE family toxin [Luteolibacter sp. SL250]WAC19953.1 type II toxin-antitoxin system RelE/ParE family toxin [Luteolibacter sp. SL250]